MLLKHWHLILGLVLLICCGIRLHFRILVSSLPCGWQVRYTKKMDKENKGNYKPWTLDWTGLRTGLNYGLTQKMLTLFSIAFYSVVSL